ncbi:MAG: 30S ribosomal protein S2, partial [Acidimicrobiales bacterium]|nr:30S ribosomal protein S2 [Acidimicrobiales bacterium]
FETMSKRVNKMKEYQRMRDSGEFEAMPKKEALLIGRELDKLERNLGGIRNMSSLPSAVFVLDTKKEHIAVTEANKLGLPVIAVVDTNCDPDVINFPIPGNDDAIRSGDLMCRVMSEAVIEGRLMSAKRHGVPEKAERSEEEQAAIAEQQARARAEAARQMQEREARVAAQLAEKAAKSDTADDTAAGDTAAEAGTVEATAPADTADTTDTNEE